MTEKHIQFMEKDIMSNIRTTEILINQLEAFLQYS